MLSARISTILLIILGILSLGNDLTETLSFILLASAGMFISWWQQKNKTLPYLKSIINILLVIVAFKAILTFFIDKPQDILTGLIKTWVYFLILSSFIIYSHRDYYIIQLLSLGLIVCSSFYATTGAPLLLGYILFFLMVWLIALRAINILPETKEEKEAFSKEGRAYRELKILAVLFFGIIIASIPLYLFIPRLKIPAPIIRRLLEQRYSLAHLDFPKENLISFLTHTEEKTSTIQKPKEGIVSIGPSAQEGLISSPANAQHKFIHGPPEATEEIDKLEKRIQEINRQLLETASKGKMPNIKESMEEWQKLLDKKQELLEKKDALEKALGRLKENYLNTVQAKNNIEINEPQNKNLLAQTEEKIMTMEYGIKATVNKRDTLNKDINTTNTAIESVRSFIYNQSMEIKKLWSMKESAENELQAVQEQIMKTQENTSAPAAAEVPPPETKKTTRVLSIMDWLIFLLLILIFFWVTSYAIIFFLPYLKQKMRIKQASLRQEYYLSISRIYNFLCHILAIFGYEYPVVITPEEQAKIISRKLETITKDYSLLTEMFIEARYSSHNFIKEQEEKALDCYRNILEELKKNGSFWQRLILGISCVFNL